jgi:hypothetical protein
MLGARDASQASTHSCQCVSVSRSRATPRPSRRVETRFHHGLLGHVAETQLIGVRVHDPFTLVTVVVTVGAAALLAAYLPAQRVTRVDPSAHFGRNSAPAVGAIFWRQASQ